MTQMKNIQTNKQTNKQKNKQIFFKIKNISAKSSPIITKLSGIFLGVSWDNLNERNKSQINKQSNK